MRSEGGSQIHVIGQWDTDLPPPHRQTVERPSLVATSITIAECKVLVFLGLVDYPLDCETPDDR